MRTLLIALAGWLLLASATLARQNAADNDAIDALLRSMAEAVMAAETDTYLACIDTTEAEWSREQHNWAADLAAHTPESVEIIRLSEAIPDADTPAQLVADIEFSWKMPDARPHTIRFPAAFVRHDDTWRFAGEAWRRMASDDNQNIVMYLDEALAPIAERVIQIMPGIREHVDEGFETELDHPQVIKLYTDMRHLQQSIYLSYEEPLGGWNEPGEAIKLMADPEMSARSLRILLSHEYGHVATFTYGPDASNNIPWWAAEGVAELAAERYSGARAAQGADELVRLWAATDGLADWADMADFRLTPPELHPQVYVQGHHFLGYISERFGRTARNAWLRALVAGDGVEGATREAFGLGFEDLDGQWRASLQAPAPEADDQ